MNMVSFFNTFFLSQFADPFLDGQLPIFFEFLQKIFDKQKHLHIGTSQPARFIDGILNVSMGQILMNGLVNLVEHLQIRQLPAGHTSVSVMYEGLNEFFFEIITNLN